MLFSHEIWSWRLRLYTIFSFSLQIYARLGRTVSSSDEVLQVVACIGLIKHKSDFQTESRVSNTALRMLIPTLLRKFICKRDHQLWLQSRRVMVFKLNKGSPKIVIPIGIVGARLHF